ncbi:MAG: STAS domain-containing protein [Bacteroidota bacterium]|nr:STAS domain-containing protein [Bacteroidota bacterium]
MKVKIDTKEKFHVISIGEPVFTANMTEEWRQMLLSYLNSEVRNVILNFREVAELDQEGVGLLISLQQQFHENHCSFVCCEMNPGMQAFLASRPDGELLNITPTESEAWDMVQMEEIERELGF